MRSSLYLKFILAYAFLALLVTLTVTTLGKQLTENRLVETEAQSLYAQATRIAKGSAKELRGEDDDVTRTALRTLAEAENSRILIVAPNGHLLFDSAGEEVADETVDGFDYASFGPGYFEISTFFDFFKEPHLNVICPVTARMKTQSYTVISASLSSLYARRDHMMSPLVTVSVVNLLLSLLLLLVFTIFVYHPLQKITTGARQLASGNFDHQVEVHGNDEMATLANSLNFTARELKKNRDYQQKFISNISHDFRSPLTSIKGFTEAMADGTVPPEMYGKYLTIIGQETERLEKLTQSVLALSSVNPDSVSLNREDFDIHAVLKDTVAVFEGSCRKKKISIDLTLTGETMMVNADKEKIKQVIYNLLDNAIKFSDRNSEINIKSAIRHGKCQLSIKDEGCGIRSDELPHIWDRFYKTDESRGRDRTGTGLGLSIVREIIQAHGQTITVTSTENVGTEFVFTLPLREE